MIFCFKRLPAAIMAFPVVIVAKGYTTTIRGLHTGPSPAAGSDMMRLDISVATQPDCARQRAYPGHMLRVSIGLGLLGPLNLPIISTRPGGAARGFALATFLCR